MSKGGSLRWVVLGIVTGWLAAPAPLDAQDRSPTNTIQFFRFNEDWNYLDEVDDPSPWEAFKRIRLAEDVFLSLGGEYRFSR
ncbi:MAG: hypothetical protein AAGF12_21805 [Myxococcota bacterium]